MPLPALPAPGAGTGGGLNQGGELNSFDDRRRGHAVTDAHGLQAILRLAPLQLVDQLGHQDGASPAACTERSRSAAGVVPSVRICQTIRLPICRFAS